MDAGNRVFGWLALAGALLRPKGSESAMGCAFLSGAARVLLGFAGVKDSGNISDILDERGVGDLAQVGWDLQAVVVGGFAGAAAAGIDLVGHLRARPRAGPGDDVRTR